jgi:hypothetical protein
MVAASGSIWSCEMDNAGGDTRLGPRSAFAAGALASSLLAYAIPGFIAPLLQGEWPPLRLWIATPIAALIGGLDIWAAFAAALWLMARRFGDILHPWRGLIAGGWAGVVYIAAAFLCARAFTDLYAGGSPGWLEAMALVLTPAVPASFLALAYRYGLPVFQEPTVMLIVVSPLPACLLGGALYGWLRRPRTEVAPGVDLEAEA